VPGYSSQFLAAHRPHYPPLPCPPPPI